MSRGTDIEPACGERQLRDGGVDGEEQLLPAPVTRLDERLCDQHVARTSSATALFALFSVRTATEHSTTGCIMSTSPTATSPPSRDDKSLVGS